MRDERAWRKQSTYSWVAGEYTICAVRLNGVLFYELWRNSAFRARMTDAQSCRELAAARGAQ